MIVTIELGTGHQVQGDVIHIGPTYATVRVFGRRYTGRLIRSERR